MPPVSGPITFVIGGARSGKSRYAEGLLAAFPPPWAYVATAEAGDDEMAARIEEHRTRRGGNWRTVEAPRDLAAALEACAGMPVLVDCLTLWLSNLMLAEADIAAATARLERRWRRRRRPSSSSPTKSGSASCRRRRSAGASATPRACSTSASPRAPTRSC